MTLYALDYNKELVETIKQVTMSEAKMSDKEVLDAAKQLAKNAKDKKTKDFGQGLVDFYKKNKSFTPEQVGGLQNIMKNAGFQLAKEEVELLDEMTKVDKKTIDNFYKQKEDDSSFLVNSTGKTLEKVGFAGAQRIAKWEDGKVKIVAKMDDRQTQEIVNYIRKTFPKNLVVEARQLKDPDSEMLVVKNGKVKTIDKSDWKKYEKMGYEIAEETELDEASARYSDEWQRGASVIKVGNIQLIRNRKTQVHSIEKNGKRIGDFSLGDMDNWVVNIDGLDRQWTLDSIDQLVTKLRGIKESLGEARMGKRIQIAVPETDSAKARKYFKDAELDVDIGTKGNKAVFDFSVLDSEDYEQIADDLRSAKVRFSVVKESADDIAERFNLVPAVKLKMKDVKDSTSVVIDKREEIVFMSNKKEEAQEWMKSNVQRRGTLVRIEYSDLKDKAAMEKVRRYLKEDSGDSVDGDELTEAMSDKQFDNLEKLLYILMMDSKRQMTDDEIAEANKKWNFGLSFKDLASIKAFAEKRNYITKNGSVWQIAARGQQFINSREESVETTQDTISEATPSYFVHIPTNRNKKDRMFSKLENAVAAAKGRRGYVYYYPAGSKDKKIVYDDIIDSKVVGRKDESVEMDEAFIRDIHAPGVLWAKNKSPYGAVSYLGVNPKTGDIWTQSSSGVSLAITNFFYMLPPRSFYDKTPKYREQFISLIQKEVIRGNKPLHKVASEFTKIKWEPASASEIKRK